MAKKKTTNRKVSVSKKYTGKKRPAKWIVGALAALSVAFASATTFEPIREGIRNLPAGEQIVQVIDAVAEALPILSDYMDGENLGTTEGSISLAEIPPYSGEPYVEINGNIPFFTEDDLITVAYEQYAQLDSLGRCGVTEACIGKELMPTEERESISSVKPSGWVNVPYDFVDGRYLYNRCHLIGFQLSGENANKNNLITGTRYMNTEGMLGFENEVAEYVKATGNHVMYRVTPIFEGDNLVASGVLMEAYSVEDKGSGVCFNIYTYNVQPGVEIDYATGVSWEK